MILLYMIYMANFHHPAAVFPSLFNPEWVIILPLLFRTAVSRIVLSFIEDVSGYTVKKLKAR